MLSRPIRFCLPAVLLMTATTAFAQTPTHIYELNGSFADTLGGPAIDNTGGATLTATGLAFSAGQGPSLSNAIDADNYSIEMYFNIDLTGGYRKLVDFKNRASDTGLYNLNTTLTFYNVINGPANAFTAGDMAHLVITRDAVSKAFVGYVDGIQQISFTDAGDLAVFTGANNIAHFLRDDAVQNSEQSGGFLDFIRIYDAPLSQSEVTARYNAVTAVAVPEASPLALIGMALPIIGCVIRRRTA